MRKQRRNKNIACLYFLLPSFLGVIVFVLAPFADVCRRSLTTAVTGEFRGIDNYKQVFENKAFWLAAGNTAKFVLVCLPLLIGLGLIIACFSQPFYPDTFSEICLSLSHGGAGGHGSAGLEADF